MGERPPAVRRLPIALTLLVVGALLPVVAWGAAPVAVATAEEPVAPPPNVVVILTDDQRTDQLDAMPQTMELLAAQGATFTNGISPTPLCCPARAALLSGNYSHTSGVWSNEGPLGGWPSFVPTETQTLATALDDRGYQTGFFGRYLNGWTRTADPQTPPGWDVFSAMKGSGGGAASYYNYSLLGTEPVEQFGTEPSDYSTDVVAGRATEFITGADPSAPVFVLFAPYGPHSPFKSAPRHTGLWPKERLQPPSNEADITDKPAFMQALLPLPTRQLRRIMRKQHETLLSVDDAVRQIHDALGPDRAANTIFVMLSDNGLMNGDHRLVHKYVPYASATEIPLLMRWDGVIAPGQVDDRVFTIQDVTATIVEATGAALPTEGVGYLSPAREGTVLEGIETTKDGFTRPAYCGWRTERYLYVRYSNGAGEELYDYEVDPAELDNRATDPAYAETLDQLRATAQPACTPGPPGFLWDAEPETP